MPEVKHSGTGEVKVSENLKAKLSAFIKTKETLTSAEDALQIFESEIELMEQTVRELNRYNPIVGADAQLNLRVLKKWRVSTKQFLDAAKGMRNVLRKIVSETRGEPQEDS